jgi:hypothetical protein
MVGSSMDDGSEKILIVASWLICNELKQATRLQYFAEYLSQIRISKQ